MKVLLLFLSSFLVSFSGHSFYIELYGTVAEHFSGDPMKDVQIRVLVDGTQVLFKETSGNGKFKFVIERETEYMVEFTKKNFVTKRVALNTKGIPPMSDIPFFEIELEIDLFPFVEGVDYSVLDEPLGRATYDDRIRNMRWDNKYKKRQAALYNKFWYQYEKAFNAPRSKQEKLPKQPAGWPSTE